MNQLAELNVVKYYFGFSWKCKPSHIDVKRPRVQNRVWLAVGPPSPSTAHPRRCPAWTRCMPLRGSWRTKPVRRQKAPSPTAPRERPLRMERPPPLPSGPWEHGTCCAVLLVHVCMHVCVRARAPACVRVCVNAMCLQGRVCAHSHGSAPSRALGSGRLSLSQAKRKAARSGAEEGTGEKASSAAETKSESAADRKSKEREKEDNHPAQHSAPDYLFGSRRGSHNSIGNALSFVFFLNKHLVTRVHSQVHALLVLCLCFACACVLGSGGFVDAAMRARARPGPGPGREGAGARRQTGGQAEETGGGRGQPQG